MANFQQQKLGNLIDHSMADANNVSIVAAEGQLAGGQQAIANPEGDRAWNTLLLKQDSLKVTKAA